MFFGFFVDWITCMWCVLKILKYLTTNVFFVEIELNLFSCQHYKPTGRNWNVSPSPHRAAVLLLEECEVRLDSGGLPCILVEISQCYQGKIIIKYYGPWELLSLLTSWLSGMRVLKVFRAFFYISRFWFKWYAQAENRKFQGTWLTHTTTCCRNWMRWKQNNKTTSFL